MMNSVCELPMKRSASRRGGVTLSEVLVSIVIMSIGVVLLSTLLPISILRTAQATQLTHAVFLRNNAEAYLESNLGIIGNSQICGFQGMGVVDPLGYFLVGAGTTSTTFGATGLPRSSGGIFGYNISNQNQAITAAQQLSALTQADQIASLPDSWTEVREVLISNNGYNPGGSPPTITTNYVTTDLNVRNGMNPFNAQYRVVMYDITGKFAVVRPIYQSGSASMNGTPLGSNQLSWQNVDSMGNAVASSPMPGGFSPVRARIEVRERRFTWLMTVAKKWVPVGPILGLDGAAGVYNVDDDLNGTKDDASEQHISGSDDDPNWDAEINVAVFYNRSFKATDEASHALTFQNPLVGFDGQPGVANVDDDSLNGVDDNGELGWLGSDDNRTVIVSVANSPPLKKGAFLLEPTQLKWYRIINFTDPAGGTSTLLLDRDIPSTATQGIIMKGIVDVYSLGIRSGTQ